MANLPEDRVTASRPFRNSGVDFAGPFSLTAYRHRGHISHKGYLALFICLSTKAIHLEIVSDLSTQSFIAAFKRFTSRRGQCAKLYSDNATNFRGADKELRSLFRAASDSFQHMASLLASDGTEWVFIPPSAPHFGGLWEAGVKSAKFHLRRIIGDQILTYEEMATLSCQVEACLNSRPMWPISNDSSDFSALTPGHLLIGETMMIIPEPGTTGTGNQHPLSRWRHLSQLRDAFWRRWSTEYLQQLQPRSRWRRVRNNLTIGTLVIIHDQLSPPAKWLLGRVIDVHPGADGLVRVVTLRTTNGTFKRPVHKLSPLPVHTE